jgi:hypothetical protein
MSKIRFFLLLCLIALSTSHFSFTSIELRRNDSFLELEKTYFAHHLQTSDINEHLPHLRALAWECSSVVEIGVRHMVSTWALLLGLAENDLKLRSYTGIDLNFPPADSLYLAQSLSKENGVAYRFMQINDMNLELEPTDLLFIDSLHTYCHLTFELERFSPKVNKYIALHDTSAPWGTEDDCTYWGDYSEYPPHIDRTKRGLWAAVVDFLSTHPEWKLHKRYYNNHGFTILERRSPQN